ncbi:MAG: VTT domain-containing protein [Candidatus Nomurabacteria bacterium]|jgi:uncharacterized membrane protein YdjX (TVP38/TMEM64 family)|nr:VTT domain-containing protein [Candidatus Nomurabacteria bacterium]
MTKKRRKVNRKTIAIVILSAVILALLTALSIVFGDDLFELFNNASAVKDFVSSTGAFGPLVYVLLQVVQVVVAPIPGQVVGIIGGYLFGWWGFLLSMIGGCLGYYIIFRISRRFGRPLIEKVFKKEQVKKFDYVTESNGPLLLFLIFLLPAFPDDMICYLAGLTKAPIKNLMLAAVFGRIPGFLVANLAGMGLGTNNLSLIVVTAIGTLIAIGIGYWQRDWLNRFVRSHDYITFIKENWKLGPIKTMLVFVAILALFIVSCLFAFSNF